MSRVLPALVTRHSTGQNLNNDYYLTDNWEDCQNCLVM